MNRQVFFDQLSSFLGVPSDVKVTDIEEDIEVEECGMCGSHVKRAFCVVGTREGRAWCRFYGKTFAEFVASLQEEEEHV